LALLASPPVSDPNPKQTDDCADKAEAQKYNYASLAQAIRSANATVYSAYIGFVQTCIGIIGALLVTATLIASAGATFAALGAARGTIDAASATRDSVDLARREFSITHRPILRVRNVVIRPPSEGEPIEIEAEIVNIGNNYAIANFVQYRIEKRDGSGNVVRHGGATNETTAPDGQPRIVMYPIQIGQSHEVRLKTDLRWKSNEFADIKEWVITGRVTYRDTYVGASADLAARENFKSTVRRTAFERFYQRRTTSGYLRFAKSEKPDTEREYED
jgi:hypothetical protein